MKPTRRTLTSALLASLALTACGGDGRTTSTDAADGKPVVATTFYPTTWLVQRLGGEHVEAVLPLPADEDPISWQPSREALQQYQEADLVVVNGAELEKWVEGASLPLSRVVDTAAGFEERWIEYEGLTHTHGGGEEHSHVGVDGHTWMSPELFALQAEAVAEALESRGLVPTDVLAAALAEVKGELEGLARQLEEEVLPLAEEVRFIANHPAYDYLLADRVDLVNLDLDPEADDVEAAVHEVEHAKGDAERCVVLWEAEPTTVVAEALRAALGVPSVVFSPAESVEDPARADYVAIQRANLERLAAALAAL